MKRLRQSAEVLPIIVLVWVGLAISAVLGLLEDAWRRIRGTTA